MSGSRRHRNPLLRAEVVWAYLTRHNLTQKAFARLVGIDPGYLSQMLSGKRRPSPSMRVRLMKALGIEHVEDLFVMEVAA
ncbi:MAG: helix-turn-helix transcriptional regulator [Acidimicrobiia bacterium]|nr:helix-turn-helix transcriptional regulator [Chloroflexota bacterium]MDE2669024.1 helix-turn-helix transcriptional regulator [Chloroflexota bacterium]MXW69498.1 helix-turn-helix transcriptional regulator [Acidimicrobiia bacterium]